MHEGRRAHQHLLVADDGGQAALIHAEVGGAAVHAPLGAEQVVEELVQPAARVPDKGGGVGHHLVHRKVPKDLDAVEGHAARREKVGVVEQDAAAAGGSDPVPPGDGGPRLAQPLGKAQPRQGEAQRPGQGGAGGEHGGQAPEQPFRRAPADGGHHTEQKARDEQQRADPVEDPLRPVGGLHLATEADGLPRPLGVGVPAIPLALVQGDQIGLGGGGRRAAGHAQTTPLAPGAPQEKEYPQHNGRAVGHLTVPGVQAVHGQRVGQGGRGGKDQQRIHAQLQPQQSEQPPHEHIQPQQHGRPLDTRQGKHPQLRGEHGRVGEQPQGQVEGGQKQQEHQHRAYPHGLEALAVPPGQLRRGQIRGGGRLAAGAALPEDLLRLLLVGAGDVLLRPAHLLVVLLALLLKHVSGVVVRLLKQAVETLGNGVVRCRPLLTGELQHLVPVLWRLLRLRLRRRSGGGSLPPARRERHHLARPGRPGGRRRRALGTGRHRKGDGVLLPPRLGRAAAELRQNLLQGERLLAGHTCIPFVVPVLGHGSHLLCIIWIRGRP